MLNLFGVLPCYKIVCKKKRNNELHCNCFSWKSERNNDILECINELNMENIRYTSE